MGWFFGKPQATESLEQRLAFSKRLQAVTNRIHATDNLDEVMLDLSADICELFHCERMTLYAIDKDRNFIFSKIRTGIEGTRNIVLPIDSRSIAGHVARTKEGVRLDDAYDVKALKKLSPDMQFCSAVDQLTGFHTRQMMAAPIVNPRNRELLGVIQLLNNREGGPFTEFAEASLDELCETIAIAYLQRMKQPVSVTRRYDGLVRAGTIDQRQLEAAMLTARRDARELEDVLIDDMGVTPEALGRALSDTFKVPYEPFRKDRAKPVMLLPNLSAEAARRAQWLPLDEDRQVMTVLVTDPDRAATVREIAALFPYQTLCFRVTTQREFLQTVDLFFAPAAAPA